MRTLLNLICVMACLAGVACWNDAPAPVEPTPGVERTPAVERPSAATPEASAAKNDDAKSASCTELRAQLDAQKSFRVLATLDGSLDDQAALDAAHNAVQAALPAGSATDLRVMGVTLAAVVERPALEALCASTRVVMVRKPRIATLD